MDGEPGLHAHRPARRRDEGVGADRAVVRAGARRRSSASTRRRVRKRRFHLHVPAGAVPKDGPSAGITMTTALASLLTGRPVKPDVGMTGEVTLQGRVLPIGGVKQKVLAAHRAGLTDVVIPFDNEPDLDDVPESVRAVIQFHPVKDVREVAPGGVELGAVQLAYIRARERVARRQSRDRDRWGRGHRARHRRAFRKRGCARWSWARSIPVAPVRRRLRSARKPSQSCATCATKTPRRVGHDRPRRVRPHRRAREQRRSLRRPPRCVPRTIRCRLARPLRGQPRACVALHPCRAPRPTRTGRRRQRRQRVDDRSVPRDPDVRGVLRVQVRDHRLHAQHCSRVRADGIRVNAIAPDVTETLQVPYSQWVGPEEEHMIPAWVPLWPLRPTGRRRGRGAIPRVRTLGVRHRYHRACRRRHLRGRAAGSRPRRVGGRIDHGDPDASFRGAGAAHNRTVVPTHLAHIRVRRAARRGRTDGHWRAR